MAMDKLTNMRTFLLCWEGARAPPAAGGRRVAKYRRAGWWRGWRPDRSPPGTSGLVVFGLESQPKMGGVRRPLPTNMVGWTFLLKGAFALGWGAGSGESFGAKLLLNTQRQPMKTRTTE